MSEPNHFNYYGTTDDLLEENEFILLGPFQRTSTPILSRRESTINKSKESMSEYEIFSAGLHCPPSVAEVHKALKIVASRGIIAGRFLCYPCEEEKSKQILAKESCYNITDFVRTDKKNGSLSRDSKKISTCVYKKKGPNFALEEKPRRQFRRPTNIKIRSTKVKSKKGMLKTDDEKSWRGVQKSIENDNDTLDAIKITSRMNQGRLEQAGLMENQNCKKDISFEEASIRPTALKRKSSRIESKKSSNDAYKIGTDQNITEREKLDEVGVMINEHITRWMKEDTLKTSNTTKINNSEVTMDNTTNDQFKDSYSQSITHIINLHERKQVSLLRKLSRLIFGKNKSYSPNCKRSCKKCKSEEEGGITNGYVNFQNNIYDCTFVNK